MDTLAFTFVSMPICAAIGGTGLWFYNRTEAGRQRRIKKIRDEIKTLDAELHELQGKVVIYKHCIDGEGVDVYTHIFLCVA